MIRKIIKIDEKKCNGCGLCVNACHEGAIGLVEGKAKLLRDDYCDGLGDCLPTCPTEAISFEHREADEYDEEAVKRNQENKLKNIEKQEPSKEDDEHLACGCPKTSSQSIERNAVATECSTKVQIESKLNQWPVQIKLVPTNAPYFKDANLLIAADCTAYAYGNFHNEFIKNRITLIGCPKLDNVDYSEKLEEILKLNDIKSVTITRMEVPCCSGIVNAFKNALRKSEKIIPWRIVTVSIDGKIVEE